MNIELTEYQISLLAGILNRSKKGYNYNIYGKLACGSITTHRDELIMLHILLYQLDSYK